MISLPYCGFSLKIGTLILLWISFFAGFFIHESNFRTISTINDGAYDEYGVDHTDKQLIKIHLILSSITAIIGSVTAIFGIHAIYKNKAKYLEPFLFYYGLEMAYHILFVLVALFRPKIVLCTMSFEQLSQLKDSYEVFKISISLLFIEMVVWMYCFVVIASCQKSMLEHVAGNNETVATISDAPPPYCEKAYK